MKRTAVLPIASLAIATGCLSLLTQAQKAASTRAQKAAPFEPLFFSSGKQAKPETTLDGFMGVKWGDSAEKAKKTLKAQGASFAAASGSQILFANGLTVAEHPTTSVNLSFAADGFFDAHVFFPKEYGTARFHKELRQVIESRFGSPSMEKHGSETRSQWNFNRPNHCVFLRLSTDANIGTTLFYCDVDRQEKALQQQRKEQAKSL